MVKILNKMLPQQEKLQKQKTQTRNKRKKEIKKRKIKKIKKTKKKKKRKSQRKRVIMMKVIEFRKEDIWCISLNIISKFSKEHNNDITLIS